MQVPLDFRDLRIFSHGSAGLFWYKCKHIIQAAQALHLTAAHALLDMFAAPHKVLGIPPAG